jgi:hypothetical protein
MEYKFEFHIQISISKFNITDAIVIWGFIIIHSLWSTVRVTGINIGIKYFKDVFYRKIGMDIK